MSSEPAVTSARRSGRRGGQYPPAVWAAKEKLAAERLAMCGATVADIERAIAGMRGAGTGDDLHRRAVEVGIDIGGPPATDEAMRQVAPLFGMVLAADLAPRRESERLSRLRGQAPTWCSPGHAWAYTSDSGSQDGGRKP